MQYPEFMEICDSAKAVIPATNLSKERTLYTTNHLLSTWRVIGYRDKRAHGIKTGSTDAAGHCLISSAQEGELHFVSVVMGAERIEENGVGNLLNFSETSHLFDYGFKNFAYRTILKKDEIVQEVTVSLSKTDYVTVHPADDVEVLFPRDLDPAELERVITLPDAADAPITAGQKLGTMELKDGDTSYATVDLLASNDVEADKLMVFRHDVTLFFQKPAVRIGIVVLAVLISCWQCCTSPAAAVADGMAGVPEATAADTAVAAAVDLPHTRAMPCRCVHTTAGHCSVFSPHRKPYVSKRRFPQKQANIHHTGTRLTAAFPPDFRPAPGSRFEAAVPPLPRLQPSMCR